MSEREITESRTLEMYNDDYLVKLDILVRDDGTIWTGTEAISIDTYRSSDHRNIIYWDNIDWFISKKKKEIEEECYDELKEAGYSSEGLGKAIKRLIKRAKERNWL